MFIDMETKDGIWYYWYYGCRLECVVRCVSITAEPAAVSASACRCMLLANNHVQLSYYVRPLYHIECHRLLWPLLITSLPVTIRHVMSHVITQPKVKHRCHTWRHMLLQSAWLYASRSVVESAPSPESDQCRLHVGFYVHTHIKVSIICIIFWDTDRRPTMSSISTVYDHTATSEAGNFFNTTDDYGNVAWRWLSVENTTVRLEQAATSTVWIVVLSVAAGLTSLITVGGNLTVILSFALERSIRQPSNYFIASLAVSDFLIGTVSMPLYSVYIFTDKTWLFGELLCDLWLSLDYSACLCSIYTVFCITVDRFCSIRMPARYRAWRTERKVIRNSKH